MFSFMSVSSIARNLYNATGEKIASMVVDVKLSTKIAYNLLCRHQLRTKESAELAQYEDDMLCLAARCNEIPDYRIQTYMQQNKFTHMLSTVKNRHAQAQTKVNEPMQRALQLMDEYLSAAELLQHPTRGSDALKHVFHDAIYEIVKCTNNVVEIPHEDVDTMYNLVTHMIRDRYRFRTRMETQLFPYFYVNELTQLLLSLHDAVSDNYTSYTFNTQNDMRIDIIHILEQYEENYRLLCKHYRQRYRCSFLFQPHTKPQKCLVLRSVVHATCILLVHAACKELLSVIEHEFSDLHNEHINMLVLYTKLVNLQDDISYISYTHQLIYARTKHAIYAHYLYTALQYYYKYATSNETIHTYSAHQLRVPIAIHIVRNIHSITANIMTQLLSHIRANIIIHIVNSKFGRPTDTLQQVDKHLKGPYAHYRQTIVYDIIFNVLHNNIQHIIPDSQFNLQDDTNARYTIARQIFALQNMDKLLEKQLVYLLNELMCHAYYDTQLAVSFKPIVNTIATQNINLFSQHQHDQIEFELIHGKRRVVYNVHNVCVINNMIKLYSQHLCIEDIMNQLMNAYDMHIFTVSKAIGSIQSHALYMLVRSLMQQININNGDIAMEVGIQKIYITFAPLLGATVIGCGITLLSGAYYYYT